MGMAASQARLLSITARQHDVEYMAQSIQNAKLQLATQQDQVYEEYQAALDASTLTINSIDPQSGVKSIVAANFKNLFSSNRLRPANGEEYALFDSKGRLVVEDAIYQQYYNFVDGNSGIEKSPYAFAIYMLFGNDASALTNPQQSLIAAQGSVYDSTQIPQGEQGHWCSGEFAEQIREARNAILEMLGLPEDTLEEEKLYLPYNHSELEVGVWEDWDTEDWNDYEELLNTYTMLLYSTQTQGGTSAAEQVYRTMYSTINNCGLNDIPDDAKIDMDKFNYYMHMFKMIESCGGCVSIDDFNGFNGDASTDSEWLTSMIQSGLMSISIIKEDKKTGNIIYNGTGPSSDSSLSYSPTTTIDSRALKKAEAKYEHDLKEIDRKDKKFDLELSKLDTERNALKTQAESIKKVIENNVEKTFGIFS